MLSSPTLPRPWARRRNGAPRHRASKRIEKENVIKDKVTSPVYGRVEASLHPRPTSDVWTVPALRNPAELPDIGAVGTDIKDEPGARGSVAGDERTLGMSRLLWVSQLDVNTADTTYEIWCGRMKWVMDSIS
jgi:hypothetical protein